MRYVALLRGVNVGGNNKVKMSRLKEVFEEAGATEVRTYINSGNVVLSSDVTDRDKLAASLMKAFEGDFGFTVEILLLTAEEVRRVVTGISDEWAEDDSAKCDVLFLWPSIDEPSVVEALGVDPAVDELRYLPGAVIRRVERRVATRSRLPRIVGTPLYKQMTMRNCNTARRLAELLDE